MTPVPSRKSLLTVRRHGPGNRAPDAIVTGPGNRAPHAIVTGPRNRAPHACGYRAWKPGYWRYGHRARKPGYWRYGHRARKPGYWRYVYRAQNPWWNDCNTVWNTHKKLQNAAANEPLHSQYVAEEATASLTPHIAYIYICMYVCMYVCIYIANKQLRMRLSILRTSILKRQLRRLLKEPCSHSTTCNGTCALPANSRSSSLLWIHGHICSARSCTYCTGLRVGSSPSRWWSSLKAQGDLKSVLGRMRMYVRGHINSLMTQLGDC